MAGDRVTRGAYEATGVQIQCIILFTLIPDKHICYAQSKTDYNNFVVPSLYRLA